MPTKSADRSLSLSAIDLLVRLGRPGTRLKRDAAGTVLEAATAGSARPLSAAALQEADAAGYLSWTALSAEPASGALSALGRHCLRSHLIAIAGAAGPRRVSQRESQVEPGAHGHVPSRTGPPDRTVIEQLARRRSALGVPLFTEAQMAAARRFAADFERARLQPSVTARWSPAGAVRPRRRSSPDALPDASPDVSAAQQRVRSALAALAGTFANLLIDVCGFDRGLEFIESERNWPRHTGRIMLAGALDQLALHYGVTLCPRPQFGDVVHWGDGHHQPERPTRRPR
jgi:hypothetical protein